MKTKKKESSTWEELKKTREAVTIGEFLSMMGWTHSKFSRQRKKIRMIEGFGYPMIPVSEVRRILGESVAPRRKPRRKPKAAA